MKKRFHHFLCKILHFPPKKPYDFLFKRRVDHLDTCDHYSLDGLGNSSLYPLLPPRLCEEFSVMEPDIGKELRGICWARKCPKKSNCGRRRWINIWNRVSSCVQYLHMDNINGLMTLELSFSNIHNYDICVIDSCKSICWDRFILRGDAIHKILTIDDISISISIFQKKGYKRWFLCGRQPVRYWKRRQAQYFPDISRIFLGYCCNLLELLHATARETGSKTVIFQGREINQYWLSGKIPNNLNSISGEFSQSSKNSTEQSIWAVCGVLCRQSEGILSKSVKLDIRVCSHFC